MPRRLLVLALAALVAALALAPAVPVVLFESSTRALVVPLRDGQAYTYSYINSIYGAAVEERHFRSSDKLQVSSVASTDIRAVEYFRWEGEPRLHRDSYEQTAPPNSQSQLLIRVTAQYQQVLDGPGWRVDLARTFGEGVVRVSPQRLSVTAALLRGWRP